jgi:multiple sugar transport system substrate-binding protein
MVMAAALATGGATLVLAACTVGQAGRDSAQGAASGGVPAAKGEIRWMSRAATEAHRLIQVAFGPEFEQRNPGAKVLADWPTGNFQEKLTASIAGGDPPDLAFIAASQYQVLAAQGQVAPLDDYMKRDGAFKKDDVYPVWFKGLQFKGQQYAMPFDPSVLLLYYNRSIFDRMQVPRLDPARPVTWEEVLELARRLTVDQNGADSTRGAFDAGAVQQVGITGSTQYFWWFLPRQNGQEFYAPDLSEVTLNRPATRAALQWLVDLYGRFRAAVPSPVVRTTRPLSFENGGIAMWVWGLWGVPGARATLTDDWDVVPLPTFRGRPRVGLGWASGNALVKTARNPDGGWQLAKYLAGPEAQAAMMRGGNVQPLLKSQANHPAYREGSPPHSKDVPIREVETAGAPFFYPHNTDLQPMILDGLERVYKNEESLDAMIARLTPLMNEKLREYRARFGY